jgi:hypothetical protein
MHTAMQTNSHTLLCKGSSKKSTKHFYSFRVEWNINLFLVRAHTHKNYTLAGVAHKNEKRSSPQSSVGERHVNSRFARENFMQSPSRQN